MDAGAWGATVHGVTKSRTRLSDFTFTFTHRPFMFTVVIDMVRFGSVVLSFFFLKFVLSVFCSPFTLF